MHVLLTPPALLLGAPERGWVGPKAGLDDIEKRKFFIPPGPEFWPVTSRYTDCVDDTLHKNTSSRSVHDVAQEFEACNKSTIGRNDGYPNQRSSNFLRFLREYARRLRRLWHDRCLPNSFKFIIYQISYNLTLYSIKYCRSRNINHRPQYNTLRGDSSITGLRNSFLIFPSDTTSVSKVHVEQQNKPSRKQLGVTN
jgi:hypothetical protein